jgi:hypothetical protein
MRCAPFMWETSPLEVVAVAKVAGLVALVVADMVGVARVARVLYKLRPEDRGWGGLPVLALRHLAPFALLLTASITCLVCASTSLLTTSHLTSHPTLVTTSWTASAWAFQGTRLLLLLQREWVEAASVVLSVSLAALLTSLLLPHSGASASPPEAADSWLPRRLAALRDLCW